MKSTQNSFYCPSCGAEMNTGDIMSECTYCGHKEQACIVSSDTEELDFSVLESESVWMEPATQRCSSCGRETARLSDDATNNCLHCADKSMLPSDKPYGMRPSMVAPFKVTAVQASARLEDWLKKRFLAPVSFRKDLSSGSMGGLFLPYWNFGTDASSEYTGQAGSYYHDTEINTSSSGDRTETKSRRVRKVRWRMVSGSYSKKFSDVIFLDASYTDGKVIKRIEPFKLSETVRYDDRYISGFSVERYRLGLKANWDRAKAYMGTVLRGDITAIVKRGSDVTGAVNICTKYTDISYGLILMPVWISTYRFRNKTFNVYINGQTGETYGESPVSVLKIGVVLLALAAAAALLLWLL